MKSLKIQLFLICLFIPAIYIYFIISSYFNLYIPCVFHELTNFYCPGCGITRMFFSILKLDFYQAFRFNPFVFIVGILYLIYLIILLLFKTLKNKEIVLPRFTYYILVILTVLFCVLRNTDFFGFLAPTLIKG